MTTKPMICILCPNGCELDVSYGDAPTAETILVEGNLCPKGEGYALEELLHPKRTLTTSVLVRNGVQPQTSVKTAAPIPREALVPAREALRTVTLTAPVAIGDLVARDIVGTGIDVVVTRAVAQDRSVDST